MAQRPAGGLSGLTAARNHEAQGAVEVLLTAQVAVLGVPCPGPERGCQSFASPAWGGSQWCTVTQAIAASTASSSKGSASARASIAGAADDGHASSRPCCSSSTREATT
jgi:hypothetical protein